MKQVSFSRRGAMMLMLLVVLIIGSIVALQLLPNEELVTRRSRESSLNTEISQIREAFDLMKVASPTWEPWPEGVEPAAASIALVLQELVDIGYLRSSALVDPTVMSHNWGPGKTFWRATTNLASNSSFQISIDGLTAWDWNANETTAATDTIYLYDMKVDDYPFQNKLGELMGKSGAALKITR
jgi:type II secretory pathway pseudopilin PulG